jgi:hypothetical protein
MNGAGKKFIDGEKERFGCVNFVQADGGTTAV